MRRQFARVGLEGRVEFVLVQAHPTDRPLGIFQSHQLCLKKGLAGGAEHILIFEDDVFFERFNPRQLERACRYLSSLDRWDGFFPGCLTRGSRKTEEEAIVRIRYHCLSHACALNRPFAEKVAGMQWTGLPYDCLLRSLGGKFYAPRPMWAFQGRGGSDNQTVMIDRIRRLFGGLGFIQKANEFHQNNKGLVTALHLLALLCVILLSVPMLWGSP